MAIIFEKNKYWFDLYRHSIPVSEKYIIRCISYAI